MLLQSAICNPQSAFSEVPGKRLDIDVDWQQLQRLETISIQQGASMRLIVRPKIDGAWLTLTGVTATYQARSNMTAAAAYSADSSATSNTLHEIWIDLTDVQTGTSVTNWVYGIILKSGGLSYPIGTGRVDIAASGFTGAAASLTTPLNWANITTQSNTASSGPIRVDNTTITGVTNSDGSLTITAASATDSAAVTNATATAPLTVSKSGRILALASDGTILTNLTAGAGIAISGSGASRTIAVDTAWSNSFAGLFLPILGTAANSTLLGNRTEAQISNNVVAASVAAGDLAYLKLSGGRLTGTTGVSIPMTGDSVLGNYYLWLYATNAGAQAGVASASGTSLDIYASGAVGLRVYPSYLELYGHSISNIGTAQGTNAVFQSLSLGGGAAITNIDTSSFSDLQAYALAISNRATTLEGQTNSYVWDGDTATNSYAFQGRQPSSFATNISTRSQDFSFYVTNMAPWTRSSVYVPVARTITAVYCRAGTGTGTVYVGTHTNGESWSAGGTSSASTTNATAAGFGITNTAATINSAALAAGVRMALWLDNAASDFATGTNDIDVTVVWTESQ